LSSAQR
jgi:hypothetical protein